jgi:hypothetical protein
MGYFLSAGRGEGFPPGERLNCSPEIAEAMILNQPKNLLEGFDGIELKPYEAGDNPDFMEKNINNFSILVYLMHTISAYIIIGYPVVSQNTINRVSLLFQNLPAPFFEPCPLCSIL